MLIFVVTVVSLFLLPAFYSWTSRLNQFFFFGRTVPAEFPSSPAARVIVRNYRFGIWASLAPSAAIIAFVNRHHDITFPMWVVIIQVFFFYAAFARANRTVAHLFPSGAARFSVEVPLAPTATPPAPGLLIAPYIAGVVLYLIALACMVARGSSLLAAPQGLNNLIGAHGGDGIFGFGLGIALSGLLAIVLRLKARTRTALGNHALYGSMIATWAGILCVAAAIGVALAGGHVTHTQSRIVLYTALAVAAIVVLFRTYASRRFVPPPAEMQADETWRWGLFYCNRADPALFVQCRCGTGYTLNYGRALAWPISAAFVAFLVAILVTIRPH